MATASSSKPSEALFQRRRILVCLDRSSCAEVCVPQAVSLAKTFGSSITLLTVMQPRRESIGQQTNDALGWEIWRQEAQAYLLRIQQEIAPQVGLPVEVRIEQGRVAERIVNLARELEADLTIIGSCGQGASDRWNLGGTAQQVLAGVQGSVFLARANVQPPADGVPGRIIVPLDGSLRTESVLPAAARIASSTGAELLLVHVVHQPVATALLHSSEDLELAQTLALHLESAAERYLGRLQQQLSNEGTAVKTLVIRHASAPQCLLEISLREPTSMIVLSAHGLGCDPSRSFGSLTTYLLNHSEVSLLVLQDLPEIDQRHAEDHDATQAQPPLRASYASESA